VKEASIKYALICDDVRREENGKLILIGVYGSNISLATMPATLPLVLALGIETKKPLTTDMEIRFFLGDKELGSISGEVEILNAGVSLFPIPRMVIGKIETDTVLRFQIRKEKDHWDTFFSIPIVRASPEETFPTAA